MQTLLERVAQPFRTRPPLPTERKLIEEQQRAEVNERRALHEELQQWNERGKHRAILTPKIADAQAALAAAEFLLNAASGSARAAANQAVTAARKAVSDIQAEFDSCDSPRRMDLIHELERTADPAIHAAREQCLIEIGNLGRLARHELIPKRDDDINPAPRYRLLNGPALETRKRALIRAEQELEQLARRYVDDVPAAIAAILSTIPSA